MVYNTDMEDYIHKLKDNPAFLQFEEFVIKQINGFDTVEGLEKMTNKRAGEEAKIRSITKKMLLDILSPFLNLNEKKEPTEDQIKEAKKKFNL
jgi:hypothetical protein